jgi:transcription elongation factor GreA
MAYLTRQTIARLREELDELMRRKETMASEIGDSRTSEKIRKNGEYNSIKEEQGLIEMRIKSLHTTLASVTLIESVQLGVVCAGSIVDVVMSDGSGVERYLLASPDETPPTSDVSVISPESPLAQCLMGATVGETRWLQSDHRMIHVRVERILPLPGLPTVAADPQENRTPSGPSPSRAARPRRRS